MESIKNHIISSCCFSEEMESYLLSDELSEFELIEIILGAPIPLTQKRALLESMNTLESEKDSETSRCILEINKALEALELKDDELFTLTECWYDYDFLDENKSSGEPFFSFQALLNYISNIVEEETEDLEEGEEYTCWTEVTKWVANDDGTATRVSPAVLCVYQFVVDNLSCSASYIIHLPNPQHLVFGFELFGHTFLLGKLFY